MDQLAICGEIQRRRHSCTVRSDLALVTKVSHIKNYARMVAMRGMNDAALRWYTHLLRIALSIDLYQQDIFLSFYVDRNSSNGSSKVVRGVRARSARISIISLTSLTYFVAPKKVFENNNSLISLYLRLLVYKRTTEYEYYLALRSRTQVPQNESQTKIEEHPTRRKLFV